MTEKALGRHQLWFVAGSQELYGEAVLARVGADAREIASGLDGAAALPVHVLLREVATSAEAIRRMCLEANAADACVGVIAWMHTFSPAKMWIAGLGALRKPLLHLHTQFNAALPWSEIDMDYMNTHQSAHGDREFAFMETRLGLRRKTVVGHWRDPATLERIGRWSRAACGWQEAHALRVARFGDNMRHVAVTEGDWKTAALVRILKVMATGLPGGTSFMEDYTYDLSTDEPLVLGAHMLEVCPSIAAGQPSCEIHPLSIGAREDPVRLVFTAAPGPAVLLAMLDLGERFRLLANEVEIVAPPHALPRLPVARAVWKPKPDFQTGAEAWLLAGGPHHNVLSAALDAEILADFAEIAGIEFLRIDEHTQMRDFRNELRWNQAYHRLAAGF